MNTKLNIMNYRRTLLLIINPSILNNFANISSVDIQSKIDQFCDHNNKLRKLSKQQYHKLLMFNIQESFYIFIV